MMKLEVVGAERLIARVHWARLALKRREVPLAVRETVTDGAMAAQNLIGRENYFWAPLARSTVREKRRLGYFGQVSETDPVLRTGALRRSVRPISRGLSGLVASKSPIARYQDQGTRTIPARHFLLPGLKMAVAHFPRRLAAAWFRAWG